MAAPGEKVCLLFGRTGAGKSHLGNTIISNPGCFTTAAALGSVTNKNSLLEGRTADGSVVVFDSIGLGDTTMPPDEVVDHIAETVRKLRDGIDVLFFVIQYGRFTDVEHETFLFVVRHVFGEAVLNNMYIVFTRAPEDLVEGTVAQRTAFLTGEAARNDRLADIWNMMNRNANRIVFVENPDPQAARSAAMRAAREEQVTATRNALLPIIQGWMAGRYRNESMEAARKAYAKHLEEEKAKKQAELDEQARRIAEVEILKAQATTAEERHKFEIEKMQLEHQHALAVQQAKHDAEVAAEKRVQEALRQQMANQHSHCFAADTMVELADGRRVPARALRVGDLVKSIDSAGNVTYSPVYYSTNHVGWDSVVTVTAAGSDGREYNVKTTSEHLIYAAREASANFKQPMIASSVREGDAIWLVEKGATVATQGRVVRVATEKRAAEFQNVLVLANCMVAGDEGGVVASSYCINHRWQVWDSLDLRLLYHVYPSALSTPTVRRYVESYDNVVELAVPKLRDAVCRVVGNAHAWLRGSRPTVAS